MMSDSFWLLFIILVCNVGSIIGSISFGFWMGRQTKGNPVSEPRKFNPGSAEIVEKDPYDEAMRTPEESRRIQTMKGEG